MSEAAGINFTEIATLIRDGKLKLFLEPSIPRTCSNLVARVFNQSPDITLTARAKAPEHALDSDLFWQEIAKLYYLQVAKSENAETANPITIYIKENAYFIGARLLEQFTHGGEQGKPLLSGAIFVVRDPCLHAFSEARTIANDYEIMAKAIARCTGSSLTEAYQWWDEQAKKNDTTQQVLVAKDCEITAVSAKLDQLFTQVGKFADYRNGQDFCEANPFAPGYLSWERALHILQVVADVGLRYAIVDAGELQANPMLAQTACEALGIRFAKSMVEGGWHNASDDPGQKGTPFPSDRMTTWFGKVWSSSAIQPPIVDTTPPALLPVLSQATLPRKYALYLRALADPGRVGVSGATELSKLLKKQFALPDGGTSSFLQINPLNALALTLACPQLDDTQRRLILDEILQERADIAGDPVVRICFAEVLAPKALEANSPRAPLERVPGNLLDLLHSYSPNHFDVALPNPA